MNRWDGLSGMFEVLNGLFVLFRCLQGGESAQVLSFVGFSVLASRVNAEFPGF
jgi:hypothetical protein